MQLKEIKKLIKNIITQEQFEEIKNSPFVKNVEDWGETATFAKEQEYLVTFSDNTKETIFVW